MRDVVLITRPDMTRILTGGSNFLAVALLPSIRRAGWHRLNSTGSITGTHDADQMFHGFLRDPYGNFTHLRLMVWAQRGTARRGSNHELGIAEKQRVKTDLRVRSPRVRSLRTHLRRK